MDSTAGTLPDRPLPEPTADSQPYWDGLRLHELRLQRCARCGTVRHYPRPLCAECYSFDCEWIVASGRGKVHSWTVAHHPFHVSFKAKVPYTIVTVDLDLGVRMAAPLVAGIQNGLAVGRAVVAVYDDVLPDLTLPAFCLSD